jgi:hypothetical protein
MDYQTIIDKYKNQPLFQMGLVVFIIACIIKLAIMGYGFGQLLHR